jgi:hypothetical protein
MQVNIRQHERIAQIKKLSRYLYLILTGIQYVLWVLCPLALFSLWAGTEGVIHLDRPINVANLSILQRCLMTVIVAGVLLLLLNVIHHLRQLILYFANGDIFHKRAVDHARKALQTALIIYGLYVLSSLAMWTYINITHQSFHVSFNGKFVFGLIIFCLMYILLWALEIGRDLNEESELTI